MSWTNDEKRAAMGLLVRIAEGIESLTAAVHNTIYAPEELAALITAAERIRDAEGNDPAPVLTLSREDGE